MAHHLFDLFSIWFFISLFVVLCLEMVCAENEEPAWGAFCLIAWLVFIALVTDARPHEWALRHWIVMVVSVPIYVASGIGWALFKWKGYVRRELSGSSTPATSSTFDYLDPSRDENRERIITWMMLWPFSLLWWLLKWPRELFAVAFDQMLSAFKRIVDSERPSPPAA